MSDGLGNVIPSRGLMEAMSDLSKYNKSPATYRRDVPMIPIGAAIENGYAMDLGLAAAANEMGHMQDGYEGNTLQGKLPWHPTFSEESPYATGNSPRWESSYGLGPLGKDIYHPTQEQMQRKGYVDELSRYFASDQNRGKGIDKIVMPAPYANTIEGSK